LSLWATDEFTFRNFIKSSIKRAGLFIAGINKRMLAAHPSLFSKAHVRCNSYVERTKFLK
jgi:hypothetical protein